MQSEHAHKIAHMNSQTAEREGAVASAFALGQRKVCGPTFSFDANRKPYPVGSL